MPKDEWKRAANRAKYGPVRYEKKRKRKKRKRIVDSPGSTPCPRCGSYEIEKSIQVISDGRQQIRVNCQQCKKFFKWAPYNELFSH